MISIWRDGFELAISPPFANWSSAVRAGFFESFAGSSTTGRTPRTSRKDVFAKVYFSIHHFDHRSSLLTWIYRIAVNETDSRLRKRRANCRYEDDLYADTTFVDLHLLIDGCPTPDRAAAQRDFVNKLLARISGEDRLLLLWKEVARLLSRRNGRNHRMNESTIKVKLFRVPRKLAELAASLSRRPWQTAFRSV